MGSLRDGHGMVLEPGDGALGISIGGSGPSEGFRVFS